MTGIPSMTPDLRAVIHRIWDGRAAMHRLGVDPEQEDVQVIVGEYAWELIREYWTDLAESGMAVFTSVLSSTDSSDVEVRIFNLPVRPATRDEFMPNEIRFRSEVSV